MGPPRARAVATACCLLLANASPEQRAQELLGKMALDDKLQLFFGSSSPYVGHVVGNATLGIPSLNLNDGPQGFRCNGLGQCPPGTSTQFPSGLTIAASWDVDAALLWGTSMGKEFKAKGANVQLGPGLCLARIPKNGRNFEYMSGEDPELGYALVHGAITGIQSQGVVANAKHFIANNQETDRETINAKVDERTLFEMYYRPFKGAIDAGVGSIMCKCSIRRRNCCTYTLRNRPIRLTGSYNKINGAWSCEHAPSLTTDLRGHLEFKGWVMSDWGATHSVSLPQVAKKRKNRIALAYCAFATQGLDMQMPDSSFLGPQSIGALVSCPAIFFFFSLLK